LYVGEVKRVEHGPENIALRAQGIVCRVLLFPCASAFHYPRQRKFRILRRLRQAERTEVPVVVVTVKDLTPEERAALDELHVVAMLRKEPSVGVTVGQLIQDALRGSASLAA